MEGAGRRGACGRNACEGGGEALRWDFAPSGVLRRAEDDALRKALASRTGGVMMWVYCEQPVRGRLICRAGKYAFPVHLGFTGWRAVWVMFAEDAKTRAPVSGFQIQAPAARGTVWIDAVTFGSVPWYRQGDEQVPYINARRAKGRYWTTSQDWSEVKPPAPDRAPTEAEEAAFAEIAKRYEAWMFGRIDDPRKPVKLRMEGVARYISSGNKAFEKLGLERRGEIVVGPGAYCGRSPRGAALTSGVFQAIAMPLAYDARLNDSARARERFVDLIDYAADQGWRAGSQMGSGYIGQLRISSWVHGVYILRDYLRERGRLDREMATLAYHLNMGEVYRAPEHPGANADDVRTRLMFRLLYVLMQPDSPEKLRDMRCFVRWADNALARAPGYGDTIKPDGTVFHHATAYESSYGNNAVHMASLVYWLLRDTPFALSAETGANLKDALLTLRYMAGTYHMPTGVNGRWPFGSYAMVSTCPGLAYMADALKDDELGRAFARLWRLDLPWFERSFGHCAARIYWAVSPGSLPILLDLADRFQAEPDPNGHRVYPYAAMDFHRRRQWVASVRGWSKNVWSYEAHATQNVYGRYSAYGMLQVFGKGDPVTPADSGYAEEGWDWLRPPGATVIRTSLEDLAKSKVSSRVYTNDPFVGGVALEGRDGVWAMRFADPHYDKSFCFRKSVFFVGETILCLGSGITNNDREHPTETIVFQNMLAEKPEGFPRSETVTTPYAMDAVGNGYYFPDKLAVELRWQHQKSMLNTGRKATEGDAAVAWIAHGRAPKAAGYAWAMRPDTTDEAMRAYAAKPDFEIVRRDDAAHIVRFREAGILASVFFEPARDQAEGVVRATDRPCLAMARTDGDRVHLAIADPDLHLPKRTVKGTYTPSAEATLRVRLRGRWKLVGVPENVRMSDPETLEIVCRDGATREVVLEPVR